MRTKHERIELEINKLINGFQMHMKRDRWMSEWDEWINKKVVVNTSKQVTIPPVGGVLVLIVKEFSPNLPSGLVAFIVQV